MTNALMSTYARLPVTFTRGEGVWLWDTEGRRYLDALAGIAVCGLGHAHPAVSAAICEQARTLVHTSNLYRIDAQERLAERLAAISGMERAFFCNSGAEANEAAFKIARLYGHQQGVDSPEVIVAEGSFHGRTLATLSATGNRKVQAGFEPLVQGFVRVPYDDPTALETVARNRPNVVAVLLEPIQGEGGIVVPRSGYLGAIRRLCDEHGWLMMLDEIQTGNARTGRWFAFQHDAVAADVVTLAKGLANGVPIGACLARGRAADVLQPGTHGSTFGGNPLACSAALAVLATIEAEDLVRHAAERGRELLAGLDDALHGLPAVRAVRGRGLMIGIELDRPCRDIVTLALDRGLLLNVTAERVIRLLPPLVVSAAEIREVTAIVNDTVRTFLSSA